MSGASRTRSSSWRPTSRRSSDTPLDAADALLADGGPGALIIKQMAARKLKLAKSEWTLCAQIGDRSGFAKVFEATADDGTVGVVKLIPKQPGADRELLFEELSNVPNIVPIIDSGETDDELVIAMPRAERSLRAELEGAGGRMTVEQAVAILIDIARALVAIDGRVVHRDLKPENVLFLNGAWCLADFGIARYAEATTAPDTWKHVATAAYAAPERWRSERATAATDVYSLGVTAFELLMGKVPFAGPAPEDFRDQHLNQTAPRVTDVGPALASLIAECMYKPAGARPTPASVLSRLERLEVPPSSGAARLQEANRMVQDANAEHLARQSAERTERERRAALFDVARQTLESISAQLRESILENATAAKPVKAEADDWSLQLGDAVIGMDPATLSDPGSWGRWRPKIDVIAYSSIGVVFPPTEYYQYGGRVHSLYYCDAQEEGVYRWYETAYMMGAFSGYRSVRDPFAFPPGEKAGAALQRGISEAQVAWPFTPIDQGEETVFIERWIDWFGAAAKGELRHPQRMPERDPQGSWRD
jgi:eukaryotic-like serine/threonine-protein kinase